MGWESNCAQRPGAVSAKRARTGGYGSDTSQYETGMGVGDNLIASEDGMSSSGKVSKRRLACIIILFISALWVFCFASSHLLIYALLRTTYI